VVGTGDFNGDGKFDILLQNAATGQVWQWQMNGAAIAATNNVGSPGPSWHVAAVGDYNGDGMADVVLQNGDGHVWQWLMNGSTIAASNDLGNAGNPGLRVHP